MVFSCSLRLTMSLPSLQPLSGQLPDLLFDSDALAKRNEFRRIFDFVRRSDHRHTALSWERDVEEEVEQPSQVGHVLDAEGESTVSFPRTAKATQRLECKRKGLGFCMRLDDLTTKARPIFVQF